MTGSPSLCLYLSAQLGEAIIPANPEMAFRERVDRRVPGS
jgi:hypothetical protein